MNNITKNLKTIGYNIAISPLVWIGLCLEANHHGMMGYRLYRRHRIAVALVVIVWFGLLESLFHFSPTWQIVLVLLALGIMSWAMRKD